MGGGSGGYDRPSGDSGSGDSGDSDGDEPSRVPPPESEDESDDSNDTSDDTPPEDSPPTGGGGGTGAPVAGPGGGPDRTPEEDGSESEEDETPQNEDDEERETDSPEPPEDDTQDRNEGQEEDRDHETDDEQREDDGDDEDEEEDDGDDEDEEEDDEDDEDECSITESALLHSPNPEPLEDADEGDICSVRLKEEAVCVLDSQDRTIGAIAEPWVGTLKECMEQGRQYRARILDIDGGKCEVRITNKCLLNRDVDLSSINTAVRDQLHPELALPIEATTEGAVVVLADGSRVGDIPNPWARLLKECIDHGRSYQAEVQEVTPEYWTINIQNEISDE